LLAVARARAREPLEEEGAPALDLLRVTHLSSPAPSLGLVRREIPLPVDVALGAGLRRLGGEVPRQLVVVERDGLHRLVAAAAADRDGRDEAVLHRVAHQLDDLAA